MVDTELDTELDPEMDWTGQVLDKARAVPGMVATSCQGVSKAPSAAAAYNWQVGLCTLLHTWACQGLFFVQGREKVCARNVVNRARPIRAAYHNSRLYISFETHVVSNFPGQKSAIVLLHTMLSIEAAMGGPNTLHAPVVTKKQQVASQYLSFTAIALCSHDVLRGHEQPWQAGP